MSSRTKKKNRRTIECFKDFPINAVKVLMIAMRTGFPGELHSYFQINPSFWYFK